MNWERLLTDNNVEFITRGANVSKNHIAIKCPFCGESDPSYHLGINLTTGYWGCWRSPDHAGRKPHRLIQVLLGCSYAHAALAVAQYSRADPSDLEGALMAMNATGEPDSPEKQDEVFTHLPEDFIPIGWIGNQKQPSRTKYCSYLRHRGFNPGKISRRYFLYYCTTGLWKDRIIFPVYHGGGTRQRHEPLGLIGWTARAIVDNCKAPRYLESSSSVKSTLFNYRALIEGGGTLFICEGPFDAMKIDFYGKANQTRAVCTFGTRMTIGQGMILNRYASKFDQVCLLYDRDSPAAAYEGAKWLTGKNVRVVHFEWLKDPGEMTADQAVQFGAAARWAFEERQGGYGRQRIASIFRT